MTRVIGGVAGGRRLRTPRGDATRPTSDRVREALFSAVESWCGSLAGLRVLDLYAGSGALGLEAWSRGAASVTLVEHDRRTAQVILDNARDLGCGVADVVALDVTRHLAGGPSGPAGPDGADGPGRASYDLVFCDPPYPVAEADLAHVLALLAPRLAPEALVVVERSSRSPQPTWPAGVVGGRHKRYGETALWYGHAAGQVPDRVSPDPEESTP